MFRYYLLNRPPFIGTHPAGAQALESWARLAPIPGDEEWGSTAHGWVEYPEPLTHDQVWKYELMPADRAERCHYRIWINGDRIKGQGQDVIDDFVALGRDQLKEYQRRTYGDVWVELALEYLDLKESGLVK